MPTQDSWMVYIATLGTGSSTNFYGEADHDFSTGLYFHHSYYYAEHYDDYSEFASYYHCTWLRNCWSMGPVWRQWVHGIDGLRRTVYLCRDKCLVVSMQISFHKVKFNGIWHVMWTERKFKDTCALLDDFRTRHVFTRHFIQFPILLFIYIFGNFCTKITELGTTLSAP
jgi:hypothetical protein